VRDCVSLDISVLSYRYRWARTVCRSPSVKKFRETCVQMIGDKYQSLLAKSGAILASGILDAGGRNVVFSLSSRAGFVKMGAAVGIMMFMQNW
jgi:26S proteasome regulatory subunit N2